MEKTKEIASLRSARDADEVAELLRANGIECSIESSLGSANLPSMGSFAMSSRTEPFFRVFVRSTEVPRAQDVLRGALASEWFLRTPDGRRYHSFEAATSDVLRAHAANHVREANDPRLKEANHLAELMDREGWPTVHQAFTAGHFLRRRSRTVEGRTLDDWARSCGCAHEHRRSD